jgi:hypothetical protein
MARQNAPKNYQGLTDQEIKQRLAAKEPTPQALKKVEKMMKRIK